MSDCTCPSKPSWGLWPYMYPPDAPHPVQYFAQVVSGCGVTIRWSCRHRHPDRDTALDCARKHLDG